MEDDRFTFEVEWYDPQAELARRFSLTYFVRESGANEVEMYDLKTGRKFLKRCPYPSVKLGDLFIGAKVVIYARQLTIVDYMDDHTRRQFGSRRGRALCLVKPDAARHVGKVLSALQRAGFVVANVKMAKLSPGDAADFARKSGAASHAAAERLASDVCAAIEVVADDCIARLQELAGPVDPAEARRVAPRSLRGQWGTDAVDNAVHCSASAAQADEELAMFFGDSKCPSAAALTATFDSCTLCLIKPHAVRAGMAGDIVSDIMEQGFEVSAIEQFMLNRAAAEEFLEVYKGVVKEYTALLDELTSGPCIALEVRAEDAVPTFREFAGPHDVEVARHIRPGTLRAKYGVDKVQNAVHCTDLPEDGRLECEYFFHILQSQTA